MNIKASGRSALVLATMFVWFAGPSQAAPNASNATASSKPETAGTPVSLDRDPKHGSRHLKKYAHQRTGKVAVKSSDDTKPADAADDSGASSAIPPSVANANAQLTSADTPTGNAAKAMTARANDILQSAPDQPAAAGQPDGQVVSADQLNDVDRALRESAPPPATMTMASADAPATPPPAPVLASSSESSTWDQTSLIGKIFIGFGALLTMASAARMFMA
jgi:hypothetical protein